LNLRIQKKNGFWVWVWFLDLMDFWIFLGLDPGFFGFLDIFWVLGFPSKSNTRIFFGFEPLVTSYLIISVLVLKKRFLSFFCCYNLNKVARVKGFKGEIKIELENVTLGLPKNFQGIQMNSELKAIL
jgi:hypothetical protein